MNNILGRVPVNSIAARVTAQAGCNDSTGTPTNIKENLIKKYKRIEAELRGIYASGKTRSKKEIETIDALKKEFTFIQAQLTEMKKAPRYNQPTLERLFMDKAKEDLAPYIFKKILEKAKEAHDKTKT